VASNPRLVKEANALQAAGYHVHVIAADVSPQVRSLDRELLANVSWQYTLVGRGSPMRWRWNAGVRKLARLLFKWSPWRPVGLAVNALSHLSHRIAEAAVATSADMYIAHTLPALPAAAKAAKRHKAVLGFDAEDFHSGELDPAVYPLEPVLCEAIESVYLSQCQHLTAASPGIALAYQARYGVQMITLLNVFPLSEAPVHPAPAQQGLPKFYWFSQTLGPDRGLEAMVDVLAAMATPCELHLRGFASSGYRAALTGHAKKCGVEGCLHFLTAAPPDQMVKLAAGYSLGLSLEQSRPMNRDICLTNKAFTYLLAGVPVLLSNTTAQTELSHALGNAALLVDLGKTQQVAMQIDKWLARSQGVEAARSTAWQLSHQRYNWNVEERSFLASVHKAITRQVVK
jgi:glycosyltransferase involved in cell wall biosynthesis